MRTSILTLALALLAGCGGGPDRTPEQVAEAYLRAGSAQNADDIRANLDPECHTDARLTNVDSVRTMGVPITIEELSVTATETGEERATVTFEVGGPAHGEGGTQEILGMQVTTGAVNIEHASSSGSLNLRLIDGEWMVTCR